MKFLRDNSQTAFTLAEVVIASAIGAITIGAALYGYVLSAKRAEWSGYSLAANSLALQRLEQTRGARWELDGAETIDEVVSTNFPMQTNVLDIPMSGTNIVWATNYTYIKTVSQFPPLRMIRVDCQWMFMGKGPFTNTVVTYRAPN